MTQQEYCADLEKYTKDKNTHPMFTVCVNSKDQIDFFGITTQSDKHRLDLLRAAARAMELKIHHDQISMRTARVIDPNKLKPMA